MALAAGIPALALVGLTATGYGMIEHFDNNLHQVNLDALIGPQPADLHPAAENILIIGSNTRAGVDQKFGQVLPAVVAHTMMIVHISAGRQWAEVMSLPPESQVNIPSCEMSNGQVSAPTESTLGNAFAIGNRFGANTADGAACTIKTIEQDTGIYLNHFIVLDFQGFESMVAALGGVTVTLSAPVDDPNYGVDLPAGRQTLDAAQSLGYVRALFSGSDESALARVARQQEFMSALVAQFRSEKFDPMVVYRFVDALTKSLTVDVQLGGVTGLYGLYESIHNIPKDQVALFTLPTVDSRWTQPGDSEIFASFRNDTRVDTAVVTENS